MFDDLRSAWGARKPTRKPTYVSPSKRTEFMAHYDGGSPLNLPTHADCLARVKADQVFHMDGRGWSDIGYNGLVCQHGRAIEGRGIDYSGAHCPDHNTPAYGWQFMVGGSQVPTTAAYARMARAQADCAARSGHSLRKLGHLDGFATACPGTAIQAWVRAGMPSPAPVQEEDMANVTDAEKARLLQAADLVSGLLRERYYVLTDGVLSLAEKGASGAQKAYVLDTIDGNTLSGRIAAAALDPAELKAAIVEAAPALTDVDADAIVTALAARLAKAGA